MATDDSAPRTTIGIRAARKIATTTKGQPTLLARSPRWFCAMLPWVGTRAGTYRVNTAHVVSDEAGERLSLPTDPEGRVPASYVDYDADPREHSLSMLQRTVHIGVRVRDMFCEPHDQLTQQLRVSVLDLKERKESELINNPDFGVRHQVAPDMRLATRTGPPTPDDLDELIARVWKKPAFFLAHPRTIAAFGRECTLRGVPPQTVQLFGSPFITWRGVPLVPSDKLPVVDRSADGGPSAVSELLLMRVGEADQGVVGLRDERLKNEHGNSVSVEKMGVDDHGRASYLITLYFSLAVTAADAVAMLTDVDLTRYHDRG